MFDVRELLREKGALVNDAPPRPEPPSKPELLTPNDDTPLQPLIENEAQEFLKYSKTILPKTSPTTPTDEHKVKELHEQLKVNPIVSQLLVQRGIHTFEEARTFFRPSPAHLHDPFLMKDMDNAVQRIIQAIDNNEKILLCAPFIFSSAN